jgi:hypothetical protein
MGNVLEKAKQEQVIALGRLGWSLRRIEQATGVRRETAGGYLRSVGIALRTPGGWGRKAPPKPATLAITGSGDSKSAIEVTTGSGGPQPDDDSKPDNEVITGFLPEMTLPAQNGQRTASSSEAYRELIELEFTRGRNAMGIYQDLVDEHGFTSSYQSVQRFVRLCCAQHKRIYVAPEVMLRWLGTDAYLLDGTDFVRNITFSGYLADQLHRREIHHCPSRRYHDVSISTATALRRMPQSATAICHLWLQRAAPDLV